MHLGILLTKVAHRISKLNVVICIFLCLTYSRSLGFVYTRYFRAIINDRIVAIIYLIVEIAGFRAIRMQLFGHFCICHAMTCIHVFSSHFDDPPVF